MPEICAGKRVQRRGLGGHGRNIKEGSANQMADEQGTAGKTPRRVALDATRGSAGGTRSGMVGKGARAGRARPGQVKLDGRLSKIAKAKGSNGLVLPIVKEVLARAPDSGRDPYCIHPSEMAKSDWCHRANYYRIAGRKLPDSGKGYSFVLENIFAEGNFIHEKWQKWLRDSGRLWGKWGCDQCNFYLTCTSGDLPIYTQSSFGSVCTHVWEYREVELVDPELLIAGKEDGGIDDFLIEFKSVGLGTLRVEQPNLLAKYYVKQGKAHYDMEQLWKDLARPMPSHIRQVNIYMHMASVMGLPFTRTAVVYEAKWNQQVKEFVVKPSPEVIEPLLELAREVRVAVDTGTPPACRFGGCTQCRAYEVPNG